MSPWLMINIFSHFKINPKMFCQSGPWCSRLQRSESSSCASVHRKVFTLRTTDVPSVGPASDSVRCCLFLILCYHYLQCFDCLQCFDAVSCFSKIQIGFTFLVPAHPGSPGKRAVSRVCACYRYRAGFAYVGRYFILPNHVAGKYFQFRKCLTWHTG